MSSIKTEPGSDEQQLPSEQKHYCLEKEIEVGNSILSGADSRPPLKTKQINSMDNGNKKNVQSDSLSRFLIESSSQSKVKKEPGSSNTLVSLEAAKKVKVEKPKQQKIVTKRSERPNFGVETILNDFVKSDTNKLVESKTPPTKPGVYEIIRGKICERDEKEDDEYYNDVFNMADWKEECIGLAKCSVDEWVFVGQGILLEQQRLMGKMVHARIQLSHRFQVITELINERAESLSNQGNLVEEKLKKVQRLGKEILEIL